MSTHRTPLALAAASLALASLSFGAPQAATLRVTSTADSGPGSLRAALASAADGDTVDARSVAGTILLTSGPLVVSTSVVIVGPGSVVLAVSGDDGSGVFEITANDVTLRGLGVTEGSSTSSGAGIKIGSLAGSTIQLEACAITANHTSQHGAGIYNASGVSLSIVDCDLYANGANGFGGAIYNDNGTILISTSSLRANGADLGGAIFNGGGTTFGIVQLFRCTLSGNSANYGGGVYNLGASPGDATLTLESCTVSGNSAGGAGAIYNDGAWGGLAELEINACTFSANTSANGSIVNDGRFNGVAELDLADSIFATTAPGVTLENQAGQLRSLGHNLSSDDQSSLLSHASDRVLLDPLLGPLQDHGGLGFTHELLPGSPAIDAGNRAIFGGALTEDQRGLPRTFDDPSITNASGSDGSDIGAFEVSPSAEISKPQAKLSFSKANADRCSFSAALDLGPAFEPSGQELRVDFAGATLALTFDEKGKGATERGAIPSGRAKLKLEKRTGLWTLSVDLKSGSWSSAWAARGLTNDDVPKPGTPVTVPILVRIGERGWASELSLHYTAKAGKSGTAK
ncbi:MAG: hypothetical protein IPN34_19115 [Planctomycetes bacterium]|nr:hypothetical protein [Planctomycetota bacterium]